MQERVHSEVRDVIARNSGRIDQVCIVHITIDRCKLHLVWFIRDAL